ncbi:hypothetical protein [Massilia glaciei]|uniref:DUF1440 domain-containing protein n=1 Tax=Massilia glaciei TaxID=1524097 RepID=A0A2U2HLX5_9BURK|nr:hypothetical protein [Massilia glaciei]PWF48436.1 hypothetical protein C7C56_012005 [Massilia glaciei]
MKDFIPHNWRLPLERGLYSGAVSSVTSALALGALGHRGAGSMFAPVNAISHWFWGDVAARRDGWSIRYTVLGYLIHHASATFWAVLFERACGRWLDHARAAPTAQAALAVSALACFTDFQLTPKRLRPGFEERLERPALAVVYVAFGCGLALGAILSRRR